MGVVSKLAVAVLLVLCTQPVFSQQLRLGKDPFNVEKSAVLELYSDNQGLLLPRIADTSLINVLTPPDGMIIYFIPGKKLLIRANGAWQILAVNNAVVTSLNGNTGALTMDTSYISNFYLKVRSLHSATAPLNYNSATGVFGISQSSSSGDGYLSSTDWNTFNNKANSFTRGNLSETGSGVLTITGGSNAVIGSGTTIQVRQANASQNGFLSSADWNTFNNKLSSVDTSNIANFYLKVRSELSAGTGIGYNNSTGVITNNGVVSLNGNTGALTMDTGYISNFYTKVRSLHTVTAPLTYNSSTGLIGITQATTSTNGYLSSADWNTFNNKANSFTNGNLTETGSSILTITGGSNAVIGSGTTIQVRQANASQNGFLSSSDWNTFNNKLSSVDTGNISNFYLKVRSLLSAGTGISYNNSTGVISSTINTGNFWNISGNSGTNPSGNFIGTTDNQDLVFKANNTERARIVAGTGDIKIGDATSGTLRATQELVLRQDGDTYGSSILRLRNRTAENGAIFETTDPSITLVDFIFKTAASQRNIRYEARSGYAKAGTPSFHIGGASPDNPTLAVGDSYAAFNTNLKIGNYNTPTEALDVTGNVRFSGALMPNNNAGTSGYVLSSNGSGTAPTWRNFTLANLNDVTITSPSNGQLLQFNGTRWVNTTPLYLTSVDTSNISNFYLKVRSLHTVTAPLTYNSSTGLIGITQATTSTNGYLSSADWNTFNSKQAAGNFLTDPGGNGIVSRTALNTTINRIITGTLNRIVITNGDGVSGNPTIDVGSNIVDKTVANTYTGGARQTFVNSASTAGFNLTASADPSTPASGDFWNSTTTANSLKYRDAGSVTRTLVDLSLAQTLTNKTISGSSNTITNIPNSALTNSSITIASGTTGTDVNIAGSPVSLGSAVTLNIPVASATNTGKLSAADWSTFNSKQSSGNYLTDPGSNGIISRTALNTTTSRTLTGTANRITITNGDGVSGNPTIDISSSYAGQPSINTLGTVTTGTWNGSTIGIANGGTGQTTANTAFNALAPSQTGNAGLYLTTNGTNTSWSSPTNISNNFVFAYNALYIPASVGAWADINFTTDHPQLDGWTHSLTTNSQNFTCNQTGVYQVIYSGQVRNTNVLFGQEFAIRAVLNGTEIPGSVSDVIAPSNTAPTMTNNFLVSISSGQILKLQQQGTDVSIGLQQRSYGTTRTSITITIIRIK